MNSASRRVNLLELDVERSIATKEQSATDRNKGCRSKRIHSQVPDEVYRVEIEIVVCISSHRSR